MRLLFLVALVWVQLSAQELGALLKAYELASDLSNKTKKESAGNLVVYTRDDLERMQARTLKELFNALRFYRYVENRSGNPDILNQDPVMYNSMPIRIYLNNTELISATFGSGTIWFGDMELDFVDHVEIYQGFPSFEIGIEPAAVIVRLYSKDVEHDRGGRLKYSGTTQHGANAANAYYTESAGDLSFFLYAGRYEDLRTHYLIDGNDLSRDKEKQSFFASLKSDHHRLELFGLNQKGDEFLGFAANAGAPYEAKGKTDYYSASYHGDFLDRAMTFDLDYAWASNRFVHRYSEPWLVLLGIPLLTTYSSMEQINDEATLTMHLKHHWYLGDHTLIAGLQFRQKRLSLGKFALDDNDITLQAFFDETRFFSRQEIYSAYLQDDYALNDQHMLTLSLMQQHYTINNSTFEETTPLQIRAGYIYTSEAWYAKTFLAHQEFPPELYMMMQSFQGNPDLKPMSSNAFTQEFAYDWQWGSARLLFGFSRHKAFPYLDEYIDPFTNPLDTVTALRNRDEAIDRNDQSLELTFRFRERDKMELSAFRVERKDPQTSDTPRRYVGGRLRLYNSFGNVDLFNELLVRDGYPTERTSYDYSAALRLHMTDDLSIDLKGENLFDQGMEWRYLYNDEYPADSYLEVPTVERRIWIGLEYLF